MDKDKGEHTPPCEVRLELCTDPAATKPLPWFERTGPRAQLDNSFEHLRLVVSIAKATHHRPLALDRHQWLQNNGVYVGLPMDFPVLGLPLETHLCIEKQLFDWVMQTFLQRELEKVEVPFD
jgi:hypothetical protein